MGRPLIDIVIDFQGQDQVRTQSKQQTTHSPSIDIMIIVIVICTTTYEYITFDNIHGLIGFVEGLWPLGITFGKQLPFVIANPIGCIDIAVRMGVHAKCKNIEFSALVLT
jgi:hypothetical protein